MKTSTVPQAPLLDPVHFFREIIYQVLTPARRGIKNPPIPVPS